MSNIEVRNSIDLKKWLKRKRRMTEEKEGKADGRISVSH
jgi:hypothetical protein